MSERPAPCSARSSLAHTRAQLAAEDPRLLELLDRARQAFDELAAYMKAKCEAAGVELPEE